MLRTIAGWIVQGAAKEVVAAVLGSAAVAAMTRWAILSYLALSGPALTALWLSIAFLAYLCLLRVFSRFPRLLGGSGESLPTPLENWSPWYRQPLTVVHHKTFENQEVPLDGFKYDHCKFRNVTFKITGAAPFHLVRPEMAGQINVESAHPVLKAYDTLRDFIVANYQLGEYKGGTKDDYGNVRWTHSVKFDANSDDLNRRND